MTVILSIDTSTPATAVALRLADGSLTEARHDPTGAERPGHATQLLALAEQLLDAAGAAWADVQRIAVGVGPGAFTGLRVGVATARGLARSLDAELIAISSLQALAHAAAAGTWPHDVLAAIDARRGEVFAAVYGPAGELHAPSALPPDRVGELLGAGAGPWLAVGDGVVRYRTQLQRLQLQIPAEASPLHRVAAACICELARGVVPMPADSVLPDYLRRPDAELALEGAR